MGPTRGRPTREAAGGAQDRGMSDMKDPQSAPVGRGTTATEQGEKQQRVPRQPNERDESADSQAPGEPSQKRMGELGRKDLESGKVDTDKGPVLRDLHENRI